MYTTTVLEYLQVKQGKPHPTSMTTDDAAILGIPYPMRPGWLAEHGPRKIDMATMTRLLDALGKRVERTLRRHQIGAKNISFDVCLEHKKNLEEFFGEPVYVHRPASQDDPVQPKAKKATKQQRKSAQAAQRRKAKKQGKEESATRRPANTYRVPVGVLTVEGVDVRTPEFLQTYAWRNLRIKALNLYGRKCMCCGDTPENGAVMNIDHIKPRKYHPELALDIRWLQCLCGACNHGKGNELETDYRSPAQIAAANAAALVM